MFVGDSGAGDSRAVFKIELDDVREKDAVYMLIDADTRLSHKAGFYTCCTEFMPGIARFARNVQMFTSVYRLETSLVQMNTAKFNEICDEMLEAWQYKFRKHERCCLANLSIDNSLYDDDHAMIIVTGCCLTIANDNSNAIEHGDQATATSCIDDDDDTTTTTNNNENDTEQQQQRASASNQHVELTNLSYVPSAHIESYLGHVNLFLIRESTQIKENGGLSGFMHYFIGEVLALARAHVLALGGNALVSYKLNECVLLDNPHRNQGTFLLFII